MHSSFNSEVLSSLVTYCWVVWTLEGPGFAEGAGSTGCHESMRQACTAAEGTWIWSARLRIQDKYLGGLDIWAQAVLRLARLHDDLLAAKDPVLTLRLAGALCMLAVLSNVFRCRRTPLRIMASVPCHVCRHGLVMDAHARDATSIQDMRPSPCMGPLASGSIITRMWPEIMSHCLGLHGNPRP